MTRDPLAPPPDPRRPLPAAPRLPSEDVIVSAPMSFTGSARRIARLRRLARDDRELALLTAATVGLTLIAWAIVFVWYCMWGFLLVPYRLIRRRERQRQVERLRHRELLETVHAPPADPPASEDPRPFERIGDAERERVADQLRVHMLAGRLATDEFEERLADAHRARTRADLTVLLADLPREPPTPDPVRSPRPARPAMRRRP